MTDFTFQEGTQQFGLPTTIPDLLTQVGLINTNIISRAQASHFNYVYPTLPYNHDQSAPEVVYSLTLHFMKRGFGVVYDGVGATLTISWDHPEMSDFLLTNTGCATPSFLSTLSGWFEAGVVYLCMTYGIDLRASSVVVIRRQIQFSVNQQAALGLTSTTWGYPLIPQATISNLYSEIFSDLAAAGFGVVYDQTTGLFVISWDAGTQINFSQGETMVASI